MTKHNSMSSRSAQRGAASLIVAMVLLFGMTMVAFYANRGLLFEQKTSANQYRATSAFEVAEAGIEWATARLNETLTIGPNCTPLAGGTTFRDKYLQHTLAASGFMPHTAIVRPGCRLQATGALFCSCPDAGSNPNLLTANEPSFTVRFLPVASDPESVEIRSDGCTGQGTQCVPGSTQGASDATARVRVILKLLPALRATPQAALTAGGDVMLGGTTDNIVNDDPATNFMTVNAASLRVTWPGAPAITLATPEPPENAVFRAHFGQDMADYKGNAATTVVCNPAMAAIDCGTAVVNAVAAGRRQLWIDAALEFNNSNAPVEVGSANNPVLMVSPYSATFSGTSPVHGVLFGTSQNWGVQGAGTTEVRGAIIVRNDFDSVGNFTLRYSPGVLAKLRPATGAMVRVPGSWSDTY